MWPALAARPPLKPHGEHGVVRVGFYSAFFRQCAATQPLHSSALDRHYIAVGFFMCCIPVARAPSAGKTRAAPPVFRVVLFSAKPGPLVLPVRSLVAAARPRSVRRLFTRGP